MLGLPWASFVILFLLPGLVLATMFYYAWKLGKGTWD